MRWCLVVTELVATPPDMSATLVVCSRASVWWRRNTEAWHSTTTVGEVTIPACTTHNEGKGAYSSLWIGNPSQSYGASPAIWDHTVLPATRHGWTCPALTPAIQASTRFTYPRATEGWVDLGGLLYTEMVYLSADAHPSSNHSIATQPGVEPMTSQSQVQRPNRYTTKPPTSQSLSLWITTSCLGYITFDISLTALTG